MWELKEDGKLVVVEVCIMDTLRNDKCCLCDDKACYFIMDDDEEVCLCNEHYWSTRG